MKNLYQRIRRAPTLVQLIAAGWLLIMLLLPFHALISTWGGTTIGPLNLWKAWKEILLGLLSALAVIQLLRDRKLARAMWSSWITKLIVAYGVLHLVITLLVGNQTEALVFGLAINLRLMIFFLLSQLVAYYIQPSRKEVFAVVLLPAAGVVAIGLLQMFVLPYDYLTWFGYKTGETIAPFNTIDQQLDQLRYMSTLRGPNPLGAYLILPITLLFAAALRFAGRIWKLEDGSLKMGDAPGKKAIFYLLSTTLYLLSSIMLLFGSHSRSAWIGFALSVGLYVFLSVPTKVRGILVAVAILLVAIGGLLGYQYRDTSFVQNVIIHDNPEIGPDVTSNSERRAALQNAVSDIGDQPLTGCAPGCAGPASFYDPDGAKLSENYYLQVGQEVGVIGMGLFIAICGLVAAQLYRQRSDLISRVMLASLVGLAVANLLLHVWADDTLAYVWWGVLGLVLVVQTNARKK